jgi:hypothetical protein
VKLWDIRLSELRVVSNLLNILNLHLFHSTMGLYFLMLFYIMEHKNVLGGGFVKKVFHNEHKRVDAIIRRETQLYVNRRESRYFIAYLTFLCILFLNL